MQRSKVMSTKRCNCQSAPQNFVPCIYFTRYCSLPRLTGEFSSPFRIFPFVEEMSPHRIELIVKVRADIPEQNYGANVRVVFPVPQTSGTVSTKLGSAAVGQSAEYIARDQKVIWNIKVRPFRKRAFS